MRLRRRILVPTLSALVLMALTAVASAEEFDVVGQKFKMVYSSFSVVTSGGRVSCPVTLEGSLSEASFPVVAGTRVGVINRTTLGTCTENRATLLTETLPWSVQYKSFTGTLPTAITSVTLNAIGASIRGNIAGLECLMRSTAEAPLSTIVEREQYGEILSGRLDETSAIPLRGGFLCEAAGSGRPSGTTTITETSGGEGEFLQLFADERGTDLVNGAAPPVEHALRDVTIAANASANLFMVNQSVGWGIRLSAVALTENAEKWERPNIAGRCEANVELMRGRNNGCEIRITRKAGTLAGQNTRVKITYRYPFFPTPWSYVQEFNVIAS